MRKAVWHNVRRFGAKASAARMPDRCVEPRYIGLPERVLGVLSSDTESIGDQSDPKQLFWRRVVVAGALSLASGPDSVKSFTWYGMVWYGRGL